MHILSLNYVSFTVGQIDHVVPGLRPAWIKVQTGRSLTQEIGPLMSFCTVKDMDTINVTLHLFICIASLLRVPYMVINPVRPCMTGTMISRDGD